MAKIINEQLIEDEFDEFGIRYADGDVLLMGEEEGAVDAAIEAARVVVPDVDMTKVTRHVYITEWVKPA